jgi:hypothetical protein
MWSPSHSERSRTSRICSLPPSPSIRVQTLDPGHRAALLAPARHAAVQEARDVADPRRRRELRRAPSVLGGASDEDDLLFEIGDLRKPRAEASVECRDEDGARVRARRRTARDPAARGRYSACANRWR